jgi:hypothetical protein
VIRCGNAQVEAGFDKPEVAMFALIAAVLFVLALIFEIANLAVGGVLTATTLTTAGLLCVALHLMGLGAAWKPLKR